jgi:hypothetical protein
MILFNVRFGVWLGNPGIAGSGDSTTLNESTFDRESPTQSVRPIFAEALGLSNARSPYVYLSDGGDFENLGLFEMVLRRCRYIVVSDVSTDPDYTFQSLAHAIQQIRKDLGVPIEMSEMHFGNEPYKAAQFCAMAGKELEKGNKYCALGVIRYSSVDKPGASTDPDQNYDGILIYIKPSLDGTEPTDVFNYHKENSTFPQDSIGDQEFGEAQFESYRILGSHMIQRIFPERLRSGDSPFETFAAHVKAYLTDERRS